MKNFLIIVLAIGLAGAAFMTRPDREEFERYLAERQKVSAENAVAAILLKKGASIGSSSSSSSSHKAPNLNDSDIEFKDFYLWTVVRQKDGKTLFTGVFDRWIDNEMVKQTLPS